MTDEIPVYGQQQIRKPQPGDENWGGRTVDDIAEPKPRIIGGMDWNEFMRNGGRGGNVPKPRLADDGTILLPNPPILKSKKK